MIIPLHVLLRLRLPLRSKLGLSLIFLVGLLTITVAIIRCVSLDGSVEHGQVNTTWLILWAAVEGLCAITVGSLPSFAVFIRGKVLKNRSSRGNSSGKGGQQSGGSGHHGRAKGGLGPIGQPVYLDSMGRGRGRHARKADDILLDEIELGTDGERWSGDMEGDRGSERGLVNDAGEVGVGMSFKSTTTVHETTSYGSAASASGGVLDSVRSGMKEHCAITRALSKGRGRGERQGDGHGRNGSDSPGAAKNEKIPSPDNTILVTQKWSTVSRPIGEVEQEEARVRKLGLRGVETAGVGVAR
jgi:hypothetical protein